MNEDRASRYHRLRRRAVLASAGATAVWVVALLLTRASLGLERWISASASALRPTLAAILALSLFVAVIALSVEAVKLPFALYRGLVLERRYGLSTTSASTWMADHAKAAALGLLLTIGAALAIHFTMVALPRAWWAACAVLFGFAGAALAGIAPVVLMPLFYRFRPLERETLRDRLLSLSARAGVRVLGAFEWGLGEKTRRANAALVGLGRTRRILVSDTLLSEYSEDEIEVILAHEIAHHKHHDLWSALGLEVAVSAAALLAGHIAAVRWAGAIGASGPSDPAVLPLIALAAGVTSVLLTPAANAWSRHNERRADRMALALTGNVSAFISAMRRLGAQNLADQRPSAPAFWFFHTHPTIDERIEAARQVKRHAARRAGTPAA
jgi:STE24 endopeptidase